MSNKELLHYDLPPEILSSYFQKHKGNKNNKYSLLSARLNALNILSHLRLLTAIWVSVAIMPILYNKESTVWGVGYLVQGK